MLLLMLIRMLREMSYYDQDGHGWAIDTRFFLQVLRNVRLTSNTPTAR